MSGLYDGCDMRVALGRMAAVPIGGTAGMDISDMEKLERTGEAQVYPRDVGDTGQWGMTAPRDIGNSPDEHLLGDVSAVHPMHDVTRLDDLAPRLRSADMMVVGQTLLTAITALQAARKREAAWRNILPALRTGRFLTTLQEDPLTARGFARPRGYPGDAPLIDLIYGRGEARDLVNGASATGRRIFLHNSMAPASLAVRERRRIAADFLGRAVTSAHNPHILSIAAGHGRELDEAPGLVENCGRFLALDQDARSLEVLKAAHRGVDVVEAGVREIIHGLFDGRRFDVIYSLGLFDYLSDAVAVRLLKAMSEITSPSGQILIANFIPGIRDAGYLEAFMRWNLIYRSPSELADLARRSVPGRSWDVVLDPHAQIAYLEIGGADVGS